LGHIKIESTVRYLGIEVNDALEIAEQTDVCEGEAERTALPCEQRRTWTLFAEVEPLKHPQALCRQAGLGGAGYADDRLNIMLQP
jgi:hypothetical protein